MTRGLSIPPRTANVALSAFRNRWRANMRSARSIFATDWTVPSAGFPYGYDPNRRVAIARFAMSDTEDWLSANSLSLLSRTLATFSAERLRLIIALRNNS